MLASPSTSMTRRSRLRELRADRRRQPEAHRAHAAGREPLPRLAEIEVLRGPHLVLADAGRDDRLALRQAVDLLDHVVGLDQLAVAIVVHRVPALEAVEVRAPRRPVTAEAGALRVRAQRLERRRQQPDVAPVHALDLVDLGRVDVDVRDALRIRREALRHSRDAVVEARAERDQEIAVVDRVVREGRAVHAEHAHRERVLRVDGADAHQRRDDRDAEIGREGTQRVGAVAVDDAAARVDQRTLGLARASRRTTCTAPR